MENGERNNNFFGYEGKKYFFSIERIYIFLEYGEKKDIFLVWREKLFS